MAAEIILDFDAAFTAPIYGFKDCWDYYQQTSSIHFLEDIQVPAFILNAKNDPFFSTMCGRRKRVAKVVESLPLK
jgi:predicted alpha/beta-fold hydrolase